MSIHVHWFLPTTGDNRESVGFGPAIARRAPDDRTSGPLDTEGDPGHRDALIDAFS